MQPDPNRRYQEIEISDKKILIRMVAIRRDKIIYRKVSKYSNVLIFK